MPSDFRSPQSLAASASPKYKHGVRSLVELIGSLRRTRGEPIRRAALPSLHQLALIVGCEAIKEVTVAHLGLAFLVFLGGEDLKHFFGGSEESNLVLVVAADTVRSRRLTQIRIFLPASNIKSQYSWSHQ